MEAEPSPATERERTSSTANTPVMLTPSGAREVQGPAAGREPVPREILADAADGERLIIGAEALGGSASFDTIPHRRGGKGQGHGQPWLRRGATQVARIRSTSGGAGGVPGISSSRSSRRIPFRTIAR